MSRFSRAFLCLSIVCIFVAFTTESHAARRRAPRPADAPKHAIILLIDGLHMDSLQKADMPAMKKLADEGALIKRVSLIAPDHPHQGPYARVHTTAIPNVSLLAGNFFIPEGCHLAQDSFYSEGLTAHGVNEYSYQSINKNFCISYMNPNVKDGQLLDWAARAQREDNILFMLLHLQNVGEAGIRCSHRGTGQPWDRNIWGEGSPYIDQLHVTDAAIGKFVDDLKKAGTWDSTLLIISADHGQSIHGFHPAVSPDAWRTLAIVVGPGVKKGFTVEQADQIDLVPTMCSIMGVPAPNAGPGCGLVLNEIKTGATDTPTRKTSWSEIYNEQLREFMHVQAQLAELALKDETEWWGSYEGLETGFYQIHQILDWNEQKTVEQFLDRNRQLLDRAKTRLANPAYHEWDGPPPKPRAQVGQ
ncbi:sulfatase-like hydrolase/transferase [bacterium]|nr:sulfatase-like hydrolase/transferase [bacterium]